MRPQDIIILLKLVCLDQQPWQYRDLAADLFIPVSEISASLKRSEMAGLYQPETRKPNRQALMEFIQYGLKYVFPTRPGTMVTGMPTAHSHPFFKKIFSSEMPYAWPCEDGQIRGLGIGPLHQHAAKAAAKDEKLYLLLACVDILRVGKVREIKLAVEELKNTIL